MKHFRSLAAAVAIFCIGAAFAHPPGVEGRHDDHHHVDPANIRTWTNATTGEVVRGAFLATRVVDGAWRVSIERETGDVVVFPLADLAEADRAEAQRRMDEVKALNDRLAGGAAQATAQPDRPAQPESKPHIPAQAAPFNAFAPFVKTRWDDRWLFIESDGLPHMPGSAPGTFVYSHTPMVGITAWQQQVPLPQRYVGDNAWRIPLKPEIADKPVSAKGQLFRGAIALAANGVPIFNPIKNDGKTDTFLAGELDEFGGHCGRADDYHYHIAPTHLQQYVGRAAPIAYALDGFPIYGLFDPDAKKGTNEDRCCPLGGTEKLDELNGHYGAAPKNAAPGAVRGTVGGAAGKGLYHYHASVKYPYLNGGMRGVVTVKDDQVDPQPRASSPRVALPPLRGAKITGFKGAGREIDQAWSLEYLLGGNKSFVNYRLENGKWVFDFIDPTGATKTDTYDANSPQRKQGGGGRGERRKPRKDDGEGNDRPPREAPPKQDPQPAPKAGTLSYSLTSADVTNGRLSIDCTCDGKNRSPALSWDEPPAGTMAFAAVMHHVSPDESTHVYMVVANIPAAARELKGGDASVGTWGQNTVNRENAYAPPCSQGPGDKVYTITLYALSAQVKVTAPLTRDALLAAIKDTTLGSAQLEVRYARVQGDGQQGHSRNGAPLSGAAGEAQPQNPKSRGQGRRGERDAAAAPQDEGQRGLLSRMTAFKTDVPALDMSVILARPTDRSVTVSIATATAAEAIIEYWAAGSNQKLRSTPTSVKGGTGEAVNVELSGLAPGREYYYRVALSTDGAKTWGEESHFRTKPPPGMRDRFTFVVQADSHLDQGVEPRAYEQTLANMLAARPDFMIDLGDTFMTDKRGQDFKSALAQYDAQRYYFSRVAHSVPLFLVLGNHDGEKGTSGREADDIGPWSYVQRTSRFPPPLIDGNSYTGSTALKDGVGANYYAFEWSDAQFIVLDPYWSTTDRIRSGGDRGGGRPGGQGGQRPNDQLLMPTDSSWTSTLGRTQYDWLTKTLEGTKVKYRFVFIHHLVGGMGGAEARGGVESSPFFEWGGKNADGSPGFAQHRAGWAMPIHDLLVKHKVSAVFHGHDHLYVSSQRDGVVYQCVPQPGNLRGNTRTAAEYGYTSGTLHGSPGHVRVRVEADKATVEFIRTSIDGAEHARPGDRPAADANGAVIHEYTILPSDEK